MRRILLATSLLAGLVAFGSMPAQAAISADINLHIGRRSPNVYFRQAPRAYVVPDYYDDVYYFNDGDYDTFRYGGWYYVNDGGYWYRSNSWRGPFIGVSFESVPTRIIRVPSRYRHQTRGWTSQRQVWNDQPRYRNDGGYNGRRGNNDGNWNDNDRRGRNRNHGRGWDQGDQNDQGDQGNGHRHRHGNGNGNDNGRGDDQN